MGGLQQSVNKERKERTKGEGYTIMFADFGVEARQGAGSGKKEGKMLGRLQNLPRKVIVVRSWQIR